MLLSSPCDANNVTPAASDASISTKSSLTDNQAKVMSRLEKVGYSKGEAMARVDKMSSDEIAYFAQHPESIKRSGFILIASSIGSSVYSSVRHSQKKKEAEIQRKRDQIASLEREIGLKQNERNADLTLLQTEQDPTKHQTLKADVDRIGTEIDSMEQNMKALEDELNTMTAPKKGSNTPAPAPKR
jgi:hypothetical protein